MKKIVFSVLSACMILTASATVAGAAPVEHKTHAKEHKMHMKEHKAKAHKMHMKKAKEHKLHSKSIKPKALPKSGYGGVSE